ncbi:MAG: transcriptional regulator [Oceanospirillaceae bacterium]|nr:transcriptional regulator [Oceanospirillaceae bacterium]|tara:strand:+ start:1580 stop:1840 length:261 start_codon:yes stop_codon:yes gene_type:complete
MTQNRRQIMEEVEQQLNKGDIEFGEAIKTLRKDITGLRQQEFAKLCGVSLRTLAQIESGKGNPTIKTLNQLLRLFGMKVGITMARK